MGTCSDKNSLKVEEKRRHRHRSKEVKSEINILESLKDSKNSKEIFSFLDKKQKLKIIINNKQMQEKLGISIEDYKYISGKYKKGEKNGKGYEFELNIDFLLFEG